MSPVACCQSAAARGGLASRSALIQSPSDETERYLCRPAPCLTRQLAPGACGLRSGHLGCGRGAALELVRRLRVAEQRHDLSVDDGVPAKLAEHAAVQARGG